MLILPVILGSLLLTLPTIGDAGAIDRRDVVRRYNSVRTNLSTTLMQVGNGNFAFGSYIMGF
jgi:hypothetical protein